MDQQARDRWWRDRGRRIGRRVNLAWWVQAFLPWLLVSGLTAACGLLLFRLQHWPLRTWALLFGVVALLGVVVSLLRCRRRFLSPTDGLVRLDEVHHLHNRLTSAVHGIGDWPEVMPQAQGGLRWDVPRCLARPFATVLVLAAAAWIPIKHAPLAASRGLEEPLAWGEVESWLDALKEEEILEDEPLDEAREQVNDLRTRPMKEWYSHSSLEAGDSLREQTAGSMRALEMDLQTALAGIAAVEQFSEALPPGLAEAWKREMAGALDGMEFGAFPLDRALLEQLKAIDFDGTFRAMTPEELRALREALARGLKACRGGGRCAGTDGVCTAACQGGGLCAGTNAVCALAVMCGKWGRGGITRGPGPAPMFLKEKESRLSGGQAEALANPDYRRAALGDTLAVQEGEHDIDESLYQGVTQAGAAASLGAGGETVWSTPLVPEEQEVLTRYFR